MRRAPAPAALLALLSAALSAAGCGGVVAPDLFIVSRSGAGPHADLTLLVNEEGGVNCNGGPTLKLSDPQIVKARAIQEELKEHAAEPSVAAAAAGVGAPLPPARRNRHGQLQRQLSPQPAVLRDLQLFVLQTAQQVCHLPE